MDTGKFILYSHQKSQNTTNEERKESIIVYVSNLIL